MSKEKREMLRKVEIVQEWFDECIAWESSISLQTAYKLIEKLEEDDGKK